MLKLKIVIIGHTSGTYNILPFYLANRSVEVYDIRSPYCYKHTLRSTFQRSGTLERGTQRLF